MAETYKTIYSRGWSAGYMAAEEVAAERLQKVIDYLKGPSPMPECIIGEPKKPIEPMYTFACSHCTSWDEANECCKCKTCWRVEELNADVVASDVTATQQPVVHNSLNPAPPLRKAILTTHKNSKNRR